MGRKRQKNGQFRAALWALGCGAMAQEPYTLFASRGVGRVGSKESSAFRDTIRLTTTHEMEGRRNDKKLRGLADEVFRVEKATHCGGRRAEKADASECGIEPELLLARGARVMLRTDA